MYFVHIFVIVLKVETNIKYDKVTNIMVYKYDL
jgi:hypothetical protein